MAIADTKKCQTIINLAAQIAEIMKASADRLEILQQAYIDQGVDPTGTPLEGKVAALNNWVNSIKTLANSAVSNAFIAAKVDTHRNTALEN